MNTWDKVANNFGKVGPKYWDEFGNRLVELSNIRSGGRVLDIGMGRGASLFPASKKVGPNGYVTGIDSSEAMVNETNKDIYNRKIHNAEGKMMDAQELSFSDCHFNNIICGFGFGYIFFGKHKFNEILRTLKDGGEAGFSIWGIQEDQKWLTELVNKYIPKPKSNNEIAIKEPVKFDTAEDVEKILKGAGFINVKVNEENSCVIYKDKDEWWQEMWTNAVRGVFEQIESQSNEALMRFKEDVWRKLENFKSSKGLCFNMPVIYAFGEKPL